MFAIINIKYNADGSRVYTCLKDGETVKYTRLADGRYLW